MHTITLDGELESQLLDLANITGKTVGECLKEAVQQYLEAIEDRQDAEDAQKALEEYRRNPGEPFTLDDALVRYGLTREELTP